MKKLLYTILNTIIILGTIAIVNNGIDVYATTATNISVKDSQIEISISGLGQSGQIIRMESDQYFTSDNLKGISNNISTGDILDTYTKGETKILTIDRYSNEGRDYLYSKYYVVNNQTIIGGPYYANNITPKTSTKTKFNVTSKKGLFTENSSTVLAVKELGCKSTTINFNLAQIIKTNENQNGEAIDNSSNSDAISFNSNGKIYYFSKSAMESYDNMVSQYTQLGVNVTGILVCNSSGVNYNNYPWSLSYGSFANTVTTMAFNTSNSLGRDYWIACLEFLAERYTKNAEAGYISSYVINNEVDYAYAYGLIAESKTSLDVYMEEYSRSLRLAYMATAKYASDITVVIPLTHAWKVSAYDKFKSTSTSLSQYEHYYNTYAPYDMLNWLAEKTNSRGAYDWGISYHCYGNSLARSDVFAADTNNVPNWRMTGDFKTTWAITYTNLEVLQQYLEQTSLKVDGKIRKVFLTESGASSFKNSTTDYNNQAAVLSASWYKIANLSCIETYNYYRYEDHEVETAALFCPGLIDLKGNKKPAYYVFKYMDTNKGCEYTSKYLNNIVFFKNGVRYSVANNNVHSYKDAMAMISSTFNWNNNWNLSKIYSQATSYEHHYETVVATAATTSKDGKLTTICIGCGTVKTANAGTIKKIKNVSLSTLIYKYNGKAKTPSVNVKDTAGKTISSKYYTVTYQAGRKAIGTYKVTIIFKDRYSGTVTKTFFISPSKTSIISGNKLTKKSITLKWKKIKKNVTGYQIQYSTSNKFTKKKTKTKLIKKYKTTSVTIKKTKIGKKYYVRIRTYKKVGKNNIYSVWSSKKTIK